MGAQNRNIDSEITKYGIKMDFAFPCFLVFFLFFFLFVMEFNGPVNNEVMSSRSVNLPLFLGRLRSSKRLTSTKQGRPRQ